MIILEPSNRILAETLTNVLTKVQELEIDEDNQEKKKAKRDVLEVRLCDFDNAAYHLQIEKNSSILRMSMALPCYKDIAGKGAEAALKREFGKYVAPQPEASFDVTLTVDLDNLSEDPEKLAQRLSSLKTIVVGGLFEEYLRAVQKKDKSRESFWFALRPDTKIYLTASAERLTVVYWLDFSDKVDVAVAKIFLQEFEESRRQIQQAPPCSFDINPPLEMKAFGITERTSGLGFVSFTVLEQHVKTDEQIRKVAFALQSFRNYLQYHLKCSKAHFHSRMRARVVSLLKVLNRAKMDPEENQPKKTFTGKTFVRK
jgi:actin related protein 2/3 complex subunit 2